MTTTTDDVCPNCGDWVTTLIDHTGWCAPCSGHKPCIRCGNAYPITDYRIDHRTTDGRRSTCSPCIRQDERQRRQQDAANADSKTPHDGGS